MSNSIESIKARLKKISRDKKVAFQTILYRYFHERMLYRLSISSYKDNFCLKGGAFLYALKQEASRPTKDIDFLGRQISNDLEILRETFLEIFEVSYEGDQITFDLDNIKVETINENNHYKGVRLKIDAFLGNTKQPMQIDIGFGDIITPKATQMEYPTLLDMEPPLIQASSEETVIAEKFQAMLDLGEANGRMKDFYDIHKLLEKEYENLKEAILNTLRARSTTYIDNHPLFTPEFAQNQQLLTRWSAFLRKSKLDANLSFEDVLQTITEHLKPIYESYKSN